MPEADWLLMNPLERIQRRQRVIAMLEDLAPDLERINPGAAMTAALVMVRLRARNDIDARRVPL